MTPGPTPGGLGLQPEQVGLGHDPEQPVAVVDQWYGVDAVSTRIAATS
jgi:hypothetical protein